VITLHDTRVPAPMISSDPFLLSTEYADIPALPPGTRVITLDNGLVIIVREDSSAPVVSAQAWCKAGSIDEGKWLGSGMSHMLEHMLFKGTAARGAGRIDQEVQDAGGYMNAYTSFDRTVYWINVPSTGAKTAIDILCDIMQNATLPADEMAKEKHVILREMDMNQDDPGRRSSRRLFETAYSRSPYRYTVIGYPDVFNELSREDVVAYYREKYTPNNMFFIVVGDVKAKDVEEQIRAAFAGVKGRPLPPSVLPIEPPQTAAREVIEEAPVELGHFHYAWHIPDIRHRDVPALDVIATLLGAGHSARLYQEIREKRGLAHSVDSWTYNPGNPGLLGVSGVVDADKFDAARAAILEQIEKLKQQPVPKAELTKAVKQFTAATLATRKTMQGQAQDFGGNWVAANDLNLSERYLAAVKRLTPADLQRAAQQYLTRENSTLYALLPTGSVVHHAAEEEKMVDHAIEPITLPNGLRLLLKEDHRLPFVEFRVVFKAGVLAETAETNGQSQLLARLLLKGTKTRTAEQIVTEIESLGGNIDSYGGNNSIGLNMETLSGDMIQGLDLLTDVMLNMTAPEGALVREKEAQVANLRSQRDHPLQSASRAMRRALFGANGYGLDVNGSEESLKNVHQPDIIAFHKKVIVPENCVMAIFGDIDPKAVRAEVEKRFGTWANATEKVIKQEPLAPLKETMRLEDFRDKKQGVIVVAFPGVSIHDGGRYALELLQEALSDLGSRLFVRIRDELGLAYYVGAQHFLGLQAGYFALYSGTAPEKLAQVEAEIFAEVEKLRNEGLSADELRRAKAKLLGQKKIARQDLGGYAVAAALDELYGLGYHNCDTEDAYYERVSFEEMHAAIRRFLDPARCVVSTVRPPV
jgi:zinc protease